MKIKTLILVQLWPVKSVEEVTLILTTEKAEQTPNHWLFLGFWENRDQRTNCHSKTGEKSQYRESQLRCTYLEQSSHKLVGILRRLSVDSCEWEKLLAVAVLVLNSKVYLQELTLPDSHGEKSQNSLVWLWKGKEKINYWEIFPERAP